MTTEAVSETPTTSAPPPAPAVDMEAVKAAAAAAAKEALGDVDKRVSAEAAKIAQQKVQETFKHLAGEEKKDEIDPLAVRLIKDPVGTLTEFAGIVEENTTKKIEAKAKAASDQKAKADAVAAPFIKDYPDISQHSDIVEGLIRVAVENGKPLEEAIKEGFETTVKRLGLKSAAELARERQIRTVGLPVSGGSGTGSATSGGVSNADSEAAYIKALRERSKGVRSVKK